MTVPRADNSWRRLVVYWGAVEGDDLTLRDVPEKVTREGLLIIARGITGLRRGEQPKDPEFRRLISQPEIQRWLKEMNLG